MLSLCVAMDQNKLIGQNNRLPWHLPADLKHFRAITMGKPIIMGRKTHESIGRPLPGRLNVVLTQQHNLTLSNNCLVLHHLKEILAFEKQYDESMVIGGATIYKMLLPYIQRMYITWIHAKLVGDTYFPEYFPEQWQEIDRQNYSADTTHAYAYSFVVLERC